jgi:formylglycine-generating enzyme required for sulfatase activity
VSGQPTIYSRKYLDFDLEIRTGDGRDYPLAVLDSPAGQAQGVLRVPFQSLELENQLLKLQNVLLLAIGRVRKPSAEELDIQNFGQSLFKALIGEDVRSRYDVSLARAREQGKGLRLRLRIEPPELAGLPWELMYDPDQAEYVCLCADTPLVRYLSVPRPPLALKISPPLRVLCMIAEPRDLPPLNVARERSWIEKALRPLEQRGAVSLTWLGGQTWRDLQRAMYGGPWHAFHFIGHGDYDRKTEEGQIALADEDGDAWFLSATDLSRLLADHHSLRLVILNACEGARGGAQDLFSSTAAVLVRRGMPAVLAMQYAITDRAAYEFARVFYEALADGLPVDAAVTEARKAVSLAVKPSLEWVTPVLFLRAPDGALFEVSAPPGAPAAARGAPQPVKTEPEPPGPAPEAIRTAPLELELLAPPGPANANQPVTWSVTVRNPGSQGVGSLMLLRGREILADDFELGPRSAQRFEFSATYPAAGEQRETLRLRGPETDLQQSAAIQVIQPPSLQLSLHPSAPEVQPGQPVEWRVELANDGGADLSQVTVSSGRQVLAEYPGLPVGARERTSFQKSYTQQGAVEEEVSAAAFSGARQRLRRQARASVRVGYPPRLSFPLLERLEFVFVPGGEFRMGSDKTQDPDASDDEQPQHPVILSPFFIGKYPVTNAQFRAFVEAGGYDLNRSSRFWSAAGQDWRKNTQRDQPAYWKDAKWNQPDHPVVGVSWFEAEAFCNWLQEALQAAGQLPAGQRLRLPGEAEWEKAARGTDCRIYPWGNKWDAGRCNTDEGKAGKTTPVGAYPGGASPYGALDMAGNVWEWCLDWYDESIYATRSNAITPPLDPLNLKPGAARVVRGGSWNDNRWDARCASRGRLVPVDFYLNVGFRVLSPG